MDTTSQHYLVPEHLIGIQKDLSYSVALESGEDADDWFVESMDRLLKINDWNKRATDIGLLFSLTDHHGRNVSRRAHMGDYIKIKTLQTNNAGEDELHWMKVEAIEYDDYPDIDKETIALHIIPSTGPFNKQHLADNMEASSTFVIERCGKKITSGYHSRNEMTETEANDDSHEILSAIISWYSIADQHWESLVKGIVD